ncbi:MAG: transporter substrate-binding domain-containing protein [Pseudomonadota bacterium]
MAPHKHCLLVAGFLISSLVLPTPLTAEPVRLLANTSPPYADQRLPEKGLALELVAHLMSEAGYESELSIETWSRALEGVRIGVYDALATAWYSEERAADFLFSEPYLDSRLIILKLRSAPGDYYALEDLAGKRLGVRADYAYGLDFAAVPELTLVQENHLIQNLMNLLNGKVDMVIGDQRTVALQLQEYLPTQRHKLEVLPIELPGRSRHVAASRALEGSEKMIEAFNRALAEGRRDGSVAAIIKKWDARYKIATE